MFGRARTASHPSGVRHARPSGPSRASSPSWETSRGISTRASHPLPRHPQEVDGGDVVAEDDEDGGPCAVVVVGPGGGVVAQVGSEPGRHGRWAHGAALPLQEEGPRRGVPAQDAEGVGVDGAQLFPMAEVPGGPHGRVELRRFPAQGTRLLCQGRNEVVDRRRVIEIPEQLTAPPAGDVAPLDGVVCCVGGRDAPPLPRRAHGGAVPAG